MLNINCILAYLANRIRIAEEYGLCIDKLKELFAYVSSYRWLYINHWDCLTCAQQENIRNYIRKHFNNISFTTCSPVSQDCVDTLPPINDNCSFSTEISFPTIGGSTQVQDLHNTYICGVVDYPTDSGIPLPSSWAGDSNGDLWYSFNTGTSTMLDPFIIIYNGTIQYPQLAIYEGTNCASLNLLAHTGHSGILGEIHNNVLHPTLQANTSYTLRIANAGGNSNTGTFDLYISPLPLF